MVTGRDSHTATLLSSGKVLVAGGERDFVTDLRSAERYDPATGTWTETGSMGDVRRYHTATLLSSGKVLVAGGYNFDNGYLSSAELYDPGSGTWTATDSMGTARRGPTATLLLSDNVLVAGGFNTIGGRLRSAELYDPASATWTDTGSMGTGREVHTATPLPNGKVLVAGGNNGISYLSSAELYLGDAGEGITLNAAKRKVGGINTVRLTWSGATSTYIDVYRDGMPIVRTKNRGSYVVSTGDTGRARYTYRVCELGTSTCSNDAIATFAH
jgi:Kelch motif